MLIGAGTHRHPRSLWRGLVALVLPGQPAAGQWSEWRVRDSELGAQLHESVLVAAGEQRVGVLHEGRLSADQHLYELLRTEVADAVGLDQPELDQALKGCDRLRDRDVRIELVRQMRSTASTPRRSRLADLPPDACPREPILSFGHRVECLGRDLRTHTATRHPLADDRLACPPPYASAVSKVVIPSSQAASICGSPFLATPARRTPARSLFPEVAAAENDPGDSTSVPPGCRRSIGKSTDGGHSGASATLRVACPTRPRLPSSPSLRLTA
jgi:hypothetical protein